MKVAGLLCLVLCIVCVVAEHCNHDSDCVLTQCDAGYRLRCDHAEHHGHHGDHSDTKVCTCKVHVYVTAENCDHDDDCILTTCSAGYEVDCHHVDHHHIDSKQCTCRAKDNHHCFDDQWCAMNQDHDCDLKDGKTWHCSTTDHQCRCFCDHNHGHCDD